MQAVFLGAFVLFAAASFGLRWLNLRHQAREGNRVPRELEGSVDAERLGRIAAYSQARGRFGLVSYAARTVVVIAFLWGGGLGAYDRWISGLASGFVASGVSFLVGLSLASSLLQIPFSLYSDFRIEARHGFNRTTPGLWWSDWLKSTVLSLAFIALLGAGALFLVQAAPNSWWIWVWALFVGFSLAMTFLSPVLIEPLFFKMKPLAVEGLASEVKAIADRAGVKVGQVLEMDASRRSAHSNAYFTGIGSVKRVVLFDTLLAQMTHSEILAVLAHELGHWKKGHVFSRMLLSALVSLAALYLGFSLISSPLLPGLVGLDGASFAARAVILGVLVSLVTFPLTPLASYWSRRHEWQADEFAVDLRGRPEDLASALRKLAAENLSNLHPHPLYAAIYYSHPPAAERIRRLTGAG